MRDESLSFRPLAGLKKALEEKHNTRHAVPTHNPSRRKGRGLISDEKEHQSPEELLHEAMADVREIAEFRELSDNSAPARVPAGFHMPCDCTMQALHDLVGGRARITLSDTDEYMEWTRKGVPSGLARRLHGGEISIQDSLDLHGFTVEEAQEEMRIFFDEAKRKGFQCVKIIHGRGLRSPGGPVLKEAVQRWLRSHSIAYVTARHMDGGLGATYVLLRR